MVSESPILTAQAKPQCFTPIAEIVFYNTEDEVLQTKQALFLKLITSNFNTVVNDEESLTVIG